MSGKTEVNYTTFGSPLPGRNANSSDYRYGFNTQEKDPEIAEGIYTAEYWQYDSRLGRRWNRDPKPVAFISVYACLANNPICFTDVQGDTIKFAPGTSAQFQQDYMEMVAYLRMHDAAQIIDELNAATEIVYVQDVRVDNPGKRAGSYFSPTTQTIYWNPTQASMNSQGVILSPSVVFIHEAGHALDQITDPVQADLDAETEDPVYGKVTERKAILGVETPVARKLGEIGPFDLSRTDHFGTYYTVSGPTSTILNEDDFVTITADAPTPPQDTTRAPAQAEQDPSPQPEEQPK